VSATLIADFCSPSSSVLYCLNENFPTDEVRNLDSRWRTPSIHAGRRVIIKCDVLVDEARAAGSYRAYTSLLTCDSRPLPNEKTSNKRDIICDAERISICLHRAQLPTRNPGANAITLSDTGREVSPPYVRSRGDGRCAPFVGAGITSLGSRRRRECHLSPHEKLTIPQDRAVCHELSCPTWGRVAPECDVGPLVGGRRCPHRGQVRRVPIRFVDAERRRAPDKLGLRTPDCRRKERRPRADHQATAATVATTCDGHTDRNAIWLWVSGRCRRNTVRVRFFFFSKTLNCEKVKQSLAVPAIVLFTVFAVSFRARPCARPFYMTNVPLLAGLHTFCSILSTIAARSLCGLWGGGANCERLCREGGTHVVDAGDVTSEVFGNRMFHRLARVRLNSHRCSSPTLQNVEANSDREYTRQNQIMRNTVKASTPRGFNIPLPPSPHSA
jgi:hypothetical protein